MKILKNITIIFCFILFLFISICIGKCGNVKDEINNKKIIQETKDIKNIKTTEKPKITRKDMDIYKYLEYMANKTLSKKANNGKNKFINVVLYDEKTACITLNADDNFTQKWIIDGMLNDIEKYLKKIIKDDEILNLKSIEIVFKFPLVDIYGNTKDKIVFRFKISIESLKKINWNNFNVNDFKKIADTYIIHKALK